MYISGTWKKSFVHETRWRPPVIRDNTLRLLKSRLLKNRRAWGHSDIHRTKSKVKYFLAWTKKHFFLSIGLDNGQEEKNMGTFIFFYSCLEWRTDYLWLQIQTCDPTRCDYSTFSILFLTSYFIVSKWWLIAEWNKSCFFFPLVNFGISWTAKKLLSGLDVTLFTSLHTYDVSPHVTWIGPFSKWPSIKHQKKFVENLILHNVLLICSFRIL